MKRLSLASVLFCIALAVAAQTAFSAEPARKWVVYLLPHSHVDIGYTHVQPEVEQKQMHSLDVAMELCRKTADYPPEARFKWNTEVLWAVDSYFRKAPPEKQQQLIDAIRAGQIELQALYGNELTGLCRPEELVRLCDCAKRLAKRCGVTVESAMISDVPGLTWGTVPSLAQAGVKYMSLGINFIDGGRTFPAWEDKPFYWLGPDGRQKLLCWLPYKGYALGHSGVNFKLTERLPERLAELEKIGYPYDIVQLRWNIGGDNGPPDASLPDVVKNWNAKHVYPKMVIATASELFHEFEKRYGDKIPVVSGDFTPYWENGACSSAQETAINRTAAERLVQAETLSAMLNPSQYSAEQFAEAWRNVILYDEHTWGAFNSIDEPDKQFVKDQWKIKQAFALDGDAQSQKLLASTLASRGSEPKTNAVDVFNTSCWPRTDLIVLDKQISIAGDVVVGPDGKAATSQRLTTGELAFLAKDVPGLAGRRYVIAPGKASAQGNAKADAVSVSSPAVSVQVDSATGAIVSLKSAALGTELCDAKSGVGLNRYYYVLGTNVKDAKQAGPAKITVKEAGPLVASLLVESDAPGCAKLRREIRVVDGLNRVDLVNVINKKPVRAKEGVHLGFAFNVPNGTMRMDIPWAVMQPEVDQIPGSCKNWFSVGRWVDVANGQYGVTWATLDAPMVLVGGITIDKIGSLPNPNDWLAKLEPSQTLYSMVMNNHWWTNYKADQEGPTTFRYAICPHGAYDAGAAQRFGIECSQPLVAVAARGPVPVEKSLLRIEPAGVVVTSVQPVENGTQLVVRLFNATGAATKATIRDSAGDVVGTFDMNPWEIVTRQVPAAR
jgi:alpha-mannosidase